MSISFLMKAAMSFSTLYFSKASVAQSTASLGWSVGIFYHQIWYINAEQWATIKHDCTEANLLFFDTRLKCLDLLHLFRHVCILYHSFLIRHGDSLDGVWNRDNSSFVQNPWTITTHHVLISLKTMSDAITSQHHHQNYITDKYRCFLYLRKWSNVDKTMDNGWNIENRLSALLCMISTWFDFPSSRKRQNWFSSMVSLRTAPTIDIWMDWPFAIVLLKDHISPHCNMRYDLWHKQVCIIQLLVNEKNVQSVWMNAK